MNLDQVLEDKKVLTGKVISVKYNSELKQEVLVLLHEGRKVIMPKDEIDIEKEWESLIGFTGRVLSFIAINKIGQMLIVSRKELQKLKRNEVLQKLKEGEVFEGRIINILKYGAYIEVDGVLTALLKNKDFSNGFISIKEAFRKNDTLKVKLQRSSTDTKILLQTTESYVPDIAGYFEKVNEGDIVPGRLKTLRPNMCFVNLAPGVDGLAPVPFIEVDEDMDVNFEIKSINKDTLRIRGKVVSIKN